jgi:acyl transferase domain-containing protein
VSSQELQESVEAIAVIGMAGRFPGARDIEEYWRNLREGVESISFFDEKDLVGVEASIARNPNYVRAAGILDDIASFDASFFGFSPREAEVMDPQHRLFLECAWEALENAGYDPETCPGLIGVYGGMNMSKYLLNNLLPNTALVETVGPLQIRILNDKDFLTSLTSYELNLKGPCVTIQTACSTSLVAICVACQSLLSYQCDVALAGGVSIEIPHRAGYWHVEGVTSPDGHCRAFDAGAQGTVQGNGLGIVVLKRLADAVADGDYIHAVVKGSAVNNDGAMKVGFTATSIDGQVDVIAMAQALANVQPESIEYIEAHGTATLLGDPVEVAALSQVFRAGTQRKGFCALGSVKTNIGHLDAAAGVAGFIKAVLSLKHKQIPPSLHFSTPNPSIDFANSPFYVNNRLVEWKGNVGPRRAGVSSFSLGGVNAHVILEESPTINSPSPTQRDQLLVISAKSESALEQATDRLTEFLRQHPESSLPDVAYTCQIGRRAFRYRRALVCNDAQDAVAALESRDPSRVLNSVNDTRRRPVAFMFPGLGNQYVNMGLELYQREPVFRAQVDLCCETLEPHLGFDLKTVLYPPGQDRLNRSGDEKREGPRVDLRKMLGRDSQADAATVRLNETLCSQPAMFVIEYALAKWWMAQGILPQALIGYSIGEHVAACLAGVFALEDALQLVVKRARLIETLPPGAMLAVSLSESEARQLLGKDLSLSAVNGPSTCVLAGTLEAIDAVENRLLKKGISCRRPQTTHAFHSARMEPVRASLTELFGQVKLNVPRIPFLSNVTGTWITAEQATDSAYWADHLCRTVRFEDGLRELLQTPDRVLIEIGPGPSLSAWAAQHPSNVGEDTVIVSSLRHSYDLQSDTLYLMNHVARLWLAGVSMDWAQFHGEDKRSRVPLPTYPFERQNYWIDPPKDQKKIETIDFEKKVDISEWFYLPVWKQTPLLPFPEGNEKPEIRYLIFEDDFGLAGAVSKELEARGGRVTKVKSGDAFARIQQDTFLLEPADAQGYKRLVKELEAQNALPEVILHFWNIDDGQALPGESVETAHRLQSLGFFSLLFLTQALGEAKLDQPLELLVISTQMQQVTGTDEICPAKATTLGPCKVISREYPRIKCRSVDVRLPGLNKPAPQALINQLLAEASSSAEDTAIAYRGLHRWIQDYSPVRVEAGQGNERMLRERGLYLITGGVGGVGLELAEFLVRRANARIALVNRQALPPRESWQQYLEQNPANEEISRKLEKLLALEQMGGELYCYTADVADIHAMKSVVDDLHQRFGAINGVIHAAGVFPGGLMQMKTEAQASAVLKPKVFGTIVLDEILRGENPDFFLLCSSLTAIVGSFGMVDHCAANAFLDAYAQQQTGGTGTLTISVNWDTWVGIGQAAASPSITAKTTAPSPGSGRQVGHPIYDLHLSERSGEEVFVSYLETKKHWVINEHKMMGNGLMPGAGYLEMARAAFTQISNGPIRMENVRFIAPLLITDGARKEARTVINKHDESFEFRIISKAAEGADAGVEWQDHVRGKLSIVGEKVNIGCDLREIKSRCRLMESPGGQDALSMPADFESRLQSQDNPYIQHMSFGPRWQNILKKLYYGENEWLALLELAEEFESDLSQYKLHPSLLDAATGIVQLVGRGAYLPIGYESLTLREHLPRCIYSHVISRPIKPDGELLLCDVTIMDLNGKELVEIEGYMLKRIEDETFNTLSEMGRSEERVVPEIERNAPQTWNGKRGNLSNEGMQGMLPEEGIEAFRRLISGKVVGPQFITSIRDIRAAIEITNRFNRGHIMNELQSRQMPSVKHPRPNVQNPYVPPRNDLEKRLSELWQDTLGIAEVGCFDNFFELGGDSLLATSLIGRLSESLSMEFPLRTLFEAPTVAEFALAIVQLQAEQADADTLHRVMAEIKSMTPTEVQNLLAADGSNHCLPSQ